MNIQNVPNIHNHDQSQYYKVEEPKQSSADSVSSSQVNARSNGALYFGAESNDSVVVSDTLRRADSLQPTRIIDFSDNASRTDPPEVISPTGDSSFESQIQSMLGLLQNLVAFVTNLLSSDQEHQASSNEQPSEMHNVESARDLDKVRPNAQPPAQQARSHHLPNARELSPDIRQAVISEPLSNNGGDANTQSSTVLSGKGHKPTVSEFKTIEPGEGPEVTKDADGKFVFNEVVDDAFLPIDVQQGMRDAVSNNKGLDFFQDNFSSEDDMYQYLVHMANLESGGGASLENAGDAAGTNTGGSAGYMHLHMNYGLAENSFGGAPLNTQGWSKDEVLGDYSKYTELTMKHIDGAYQSVDGALNPEGTEQAMALWWTGNESTSAGSYYLDALSSGSGVNHNTGSAYL